MFGDYLDWELVLELLSRNHGVIAINLPGFGCSASSSGPLICASVGQSQSRTSCGTLDSLGGTRQLDWEEGPYPGRLVHGDLRPGLDPDGKDRKENEIRLAMGFAYAVATLYLLADRGVGRIRP